MSVIIQALSENTSENPELEADFGLSLYITVNGKSILLDTGSSGKCLENAQKLGIDLNKLDAIVLSHGHFDHTDGLVHLIENGITKVPVYFNRYMFSERYWYKKDDGNYYFPTMSGLSPQYLQRNHIRFMGVCNDVHQIFADENIYIVSNIERTCPFEEICPDDVIKINNEFTVDNYKDECVLVIEDNSQLIVITGCGHYGLVNICSHIEKLFKKPVKAFVGGTHLVAFPFERTEKTIEELKGSSLKVLAVGHCTGSDAMQAFSKELSIFKPLHTGTKIIL
ncbi:MAG: MBL fold metallo-hydrolase [Candidatus Metalachnospira sp.]|nr:MBL fold metallo-hydrolase [Candidatus Metalachnospira sp.]